MCARSVTSRDFLDKRHIKRFIDYQSDSDWRKPEISRTEFDRLAKEVAEMKKQLAEAVAHDKATNQPDCADGDKMEMVRRIAEIVGVSLNDVLGPRADNPRN